MGAVTSIGSVFFCVCVTFMSTMVVYLNFMSVLFLCYFYEYYVFYVNFMSVFFCYFYELGSL